MNRIQNPLHPGEELRDGWPSGVTITAASRQLGVTQAAYDLWKAEQNKRRPRIERLKQAA